MRDPATPETVEVTAAARPPADTPELGVEVEPDRTWTPRHRLVTIGDSLTHGFQSGAVFNTDLSYPAIIAYELGWFDQFRQPSYPGFGGLPLNLEFLLRDLEARCRVERLGARQVQGIQGGIVAPESQRQVPVELLRRRLAGLGLQRQPGLVPLRLVPLARRRHPEHLPLPTLLT
jgi:hypothetical protein